MADEKEFVLTREGKLELENELDTLKNVTRKEVSEKIKEARSFGDLSENAEYDEAKNEQAEVEARINEIEYMLKYARVIDDEEIKSDVVTPGSKFLQYSVVKKSTQSSVQQRLILTRTSCHTNHLSVRLVLTERQAKL